MNVARQNVGFHPWQYRLFHTVWAQFYSTGSMHAYGARCISVSASFLLRYYCPDRISFGDIWGLAVTQGAR